MVSDPDQNLHFKARILAVIIKFSLLELLLAIFINTLELYLLSGRASLVMHR